MEKRAKRTATVKVSSPRWLGSHVILTGTSSFHFSGFSRTTAGVALFKFTALKVDLRIKGQTKPIYGNNKGFYLTKAMQN